MCGIVGLVGDLTNSDYMLMRHLLFFDVTRGPHSTGLFTVGVDNSVHVEKTVGSPGNLYENEQSKIWDWEGKVRNTAPTPKVIIGHNRYATQGVVNIANAHPFTHGNWTGVHNGSLDNYKGICEGSFEVDSEHVIAGFNENGFVKTWEDFTGAAAIVAWDAERKQLNVARNDERPLHFATFKKGRAMIIASEPWMIEALECKSGISSAYGLSDVDEIKKDHLFTMSPTSITFGVVNKRPLKDNTGWGSYGGMGYTMAKKSTTGVNNTSVLNLEDLIKRKYKEDPKHEHWAVGTDDWKSTKEVEGIDVKEISLKLQDMQMINPYVVATNKKRRHLKFIIDKGQLTGTPVFVYLDSLNMWLLWHNNKEFLTSCFNGEHRFNFRYRPRVVTHKGRVIAIHCSIDALNNTFQEEEICEKVKCICCDELVKESDTVLIEDCVVCTSCDELYGDWLYGINKGVRR